jgi:hypothetical protein
MTEGPRKGGRRRRRRRTQLKPIKRGVSKSNGL